MANPLLPPMDPNQMPPNPFAAFAPPSPPPSPSLGFQIWASDPQNAMKVQPAMTDPNAPLQPNHPDNAPKMASINPPQPSPMASFAPPDTSKLTADTAELARLQQSGAAANHIKNPVLKTLAKIGDVAAPFILGRGAMAIPGTTAHNLFLQNQAQGRVEQDQNALTSNLQNQQTEQQLQAAPTELAIKQQNAGLKGLQAQGTIAQHGLKVQQNEDGTVSVVPDETSPVYQAQQSKIALADAQVEVAKSAKELKDAQAAYNKAKTDPNSPLFQQVTQRLAIAKANAAAAQTRASAYMGRYLQSAFNTDLQGNVLPGATQVTDENGDTTTVGTGNASAASKAQSNVAMFNEVDSATKGLRQTAQKLIQSGGKLNSPAVVAAIADPKTTSAQWLQGQVASTLSPAERDYVIANKAYHERLQPLRKSAGGSVSDEQVNRLMQMAPGPQTPDLDYLNRQLDQIDQLRTKLSAGVTTAKGGLKVSGSAANPPKVTYKQTATGPGGQIGSNDGGNTWFDVKTGKKVQ